MKVYIDADACPVIIRTILIKAGQRTRTPLIFVANQAIHLPRHPLVQRVVVSKTPDAADDYIAEQVTSTDLVITADIPLADRVLSKQAAALNPNGTFYTADNIKQILSTRNLLDELRGAGLANSRSSGIDDKCKQKFANALDTFLARR